MQQQLVKSSATTEVVMLDASGVNGPYRSHKREAITDTAGAVVAELSIVPTLFVSRTMSAQRKVAPLPLAQRRDALTVAARIFRDHTIDGMTFAEYVDVASHVAGLPISVMFAGAEQVGSALAGALEAARHALPAGDTEDWRDERTGAGSGVWVRRGDVFAVHAAGNHPSVHGAWPQALALGYRVAVRPSRREPFTGHRVVAALLEAGFRHEDVVYLPSDYAGADEIIRSADLSMVFGGQNVVDKYSSDATVLANGPGRTKILITAEQDWRAHLDVIVDSIASAGGMACQNASAVLVEGDPAPLAHAIADRLSTLQPLPISDPRAVLPTMRLDDARAMAAVVAKKAAGATPLLGADQIVADLGDGYAALRPSVHVLQRPIVDTINTELAFPCVWVSGWTRADGIEPLRNSLVLNVISDDEALIDQLLHEPTIGNVYTGDVPTHHMSQYLPHDGYLGEFLMRSKGFVKN